MSEAGKTPTLMVKTFPKCVLRKDKLRIIKPNGMNTNLIARLRSLAQPQTLNRDLIIYESSAGDFLNLGHQKVTLINRTIKSTNSSHTVARYESNGKVVLEKTSEEIIKLIGKANYELVFSTLCSVINQEFKVRGILALLTTPKKVVTSSSQTFGMIDSSVSVKTTDSSSQTEETCIDFMKKMQPKRRVKRQLPSPYVLTDTPKVKRVVIHPSEYFNTMDATNLEISRTTIKQEDSKLETVDKMDIQLPELHFDEESRDSTGNLSITSFVTMPELLTQPLSLLESIEKLTVADQPKVQAVDWGNAIPLTLLDGTVVKIPVKPEDDFHIATPEIIKFIPPEHRRKLLWYQAYIDWKYCLRRDDENHLPIHTAVINQDIDFLRRQCIVLGTRNESVDIPTGDNLSALQLSIYGGAPDCTAMLLRYGADPFAFDEEYRTCFHLAAEARHECLKPLIAHCQENPLKVLQENEEFWKPELALKPKEYQTSFLLNAICSMPDNQGYTPLMLAAKVGNFENVKLLVEAAPGAVNAQSSASGNTALYQAVAGACHDSDARGNRSKVSDNFKKIIALLVENGADPSLANNSGADINSLVAEFNIGELSMLIANKLTSVNCKSFNSQSTEPLIIYKKEDGTLNTLGFNDKKKLMDLNAPNYLRNKDKMITPTVASTNADNATEVNTFKVTVNDTVVTGVNVDDEGSNIILTPKNEEKTNVRMNKDAIKSLKRAIVDVEPSVNENSIATLKQESNNDIKNEDSQVVDKTKSENNRDTKSQNLVVLENKLINKVQPTNVKDAAGPRHFITSYKNFVHNFKARQLYIPSNRIDDNAPSTSKIPNSKSNKHYIISGKKPKKPPLATLKMRSTKQIDKIHPKITAVSVKSIVPEKKPKIDIQTVKIIKIEPGDNDT